jgi:predicted metal-dependent hydrolase
MHIDTHVLDYSLVRSKRRSIGFLINDDGLRVTAPRWITVHEIEQAIRKKQHWIFTKLHARRQRAIEAPQPRQWQDGISLPYLGDNMTLRICSTQSAPAFYNTVSRELTIFLPADATEQELKDRVQRWLQGQAMALFATRLPLYAEKLGVHYRALALSSAKTLWGSCTANGTIRLNWRLIHFTLPLIDYVIAHELSHLREMNHSPRFWATVQSIFPECAAVRHALRVQVKEILPIF